jgi:hypothetical protein
MRKLLLLLAFMGVVAGTLGARADDLCADQSMCMNIQGRIVDPHGTGIPNIGVFAQGVGQYRVDSITDANGHFEFHLPDQQALKGCFLVGGHPDTFYAVPTYGNVCKDSSITMMAPYRATAIAPKGREYFYPNTTQQIPIDLQIYVDSHTNPAPFDADPLTWTVADHPAGENTVHIAQQGTFPSHTITKVADGVWQYVYTVHIVIQPHGVSMVHVDWSLNSVFMSMMDCRMYWFGMGMTKISPSSVVPGQVETIDGMGFGSDLGRVYLQRANGQAIYIDPKYILSWTSTKVQFIVPPDAVTGYFRLYNAKGLGPRCLGGGIGTPTPRRLLTVDATKAATEAVAA